MRKLSLIRMAALAVLAAGFAGAAHADESDESDAAEAAPPVAVATDTPGSLWYQEYTQAEERFDLSGLPLEHEGPSVDIETGSNWGLSLGFRTSTGLDRQEELKGVSAGAYFKLSPRMRVGGELGYRAREDSAMGLAAPEASSPQIKLESAFRF